MQIVLIEALIKYALAIYRWWKYEKPEDDKRQREMILALYGVPCMVPEDEQSMPHRLIEIRKGIWT